MMNWRPTLYFDRMNLALVVGVELRERHPWELRKHGGPLYRLIRGYYAQLRLPLRDWRFGQDHIWYDGCHCCYKLGPLWLTWDSVTCTKGLDDG